MDGIKAAAVGRLARDAELRHVKGGELAVCSFTLAVEGKGPDDTQWVRVSVWAERAEELAPRLKKGAEVYAEGKLSLAVWTADDGAQRHGLNVSAWRCELLGAFEAPKRRTSRARSPRKPGARTSPAPAMADTAVPFNDEIPF